MLLLAKQFNTYYRGCAINRNITEITTWSSRKERRDCETKRDCDFFDKGKMCQNSIIMEYCSAARCSGQ